MCASAPFSFLLPLSLLKEFGSARLHAHKTMEYKMLCFHSGTLDQIEQFSSILKMTGLAPSLHTQVAISEQSSYACTLSCPPNFQTFSTQMISAAFYPWQMMNSCVHLTWLSVCSKYEILTLGEHASISILCRFAYFWHCIVTSGPIAVDHVEKWAKVLLSHLGCVALFCVCHCDKMVPPILFQ